MSPPPLSPPHVGTLTPDDDQQQSLALTLGMHQSTQTPTRLWRFQPVTATHSLPRAPSHPHPLQAPHTLPPTPLPPTSSPPPPSADELLRLQAASKIASKQHSPPSDHLPEGEPVTAERVEQHLKVGEGEGEGGEAEGGARGYRR